LLLDLRSTTPGLRDYEWVKREPDWRWKWFHSHAYPPMVPREQTSLYSQCAHAAAELTPARNLPPAQEPPGGPDALTLCHYNFHALRGDAVARRGYLGRMQARFGGPRNVPVAWLAKPSDAPPAAHVVGLRLNGRSGAELWTILDEAPKQFTWAVWRWR